MQYSHYVISSSVTLMRNVSGYPFPQKLQDNRMRTIESTVFESVNADGKFTLLPSNKNVLDVAVLCDRAKLSNAFLSQDYASVIVNADESEVITVNFKNHVNISTFVMGEDVTKAYAKAEALDNKISSKIKYAYSTKLGYLTSSPTTIGTGMRASVTLFLPGLERMGKIDELVRLMARNSLKLAPEKRGDVKAVSTYVLSSVYTLGVTEDEILQQLTKAVESIGNMEEKARKDYFEARQLSFKDEALRSYGIATNCYLLGFDELQSLIASIRLGACLNVLAISDVKVLDTIAKNYSNNALLSERKGLIKQADIDAYRAIKVKDAIRTL